MQLISDEYKALNEELHDRHKNYGMKGHLFIDAVMSIAKELKTTDILDYGCGKGTLANNLGFPIKQYDPAIEKHKKLPNPADIVICTDVLEHVEPDCLESVLTHLASLIKKIGFLSIHLTEAQKSLSDGRNAHLIVKSRHEWLLLLLQKFDIVKIDSSETTLSVLVNPLIAN